MEEKGLVSLWFGTATSETAFFEALTIYYSEDGDWIGSEFSRAFDIERYDEGFREAEYFEVPSADLGKLLKGASYESVVVDRFRAIGPLTAEVNCMVLLYNYKHEGPANFQGDGVVLRYFGAVSYV